MSSREQCAAGMCSASRAAVTAFPVPSRSDVRRSMRVPPSSARSTLSFPMPTSSAGSTPSFAVLCRVDLPKLDLPKDRRALLAPSTRMEEGQSLVEVYHTRYQPPHLHAQ